jgi:hypothetical protein
MIRTIQPIVANRRPSLRPAAIAAIRRARAAAREKVWQRRCPIASVSHANARTNVFARRLIVERVAAGWPAAHVADSRATVYKWLQRYAEGGMPAGRSFVTSHRVEQKVFTARRRRKRSAVVLAAELI